MLVMEEKKLDIKGSIVVGVDSQPKPLVINENGEDIVIVYSQYRELDADRKKFVLDNLQKWIDSEK